MIYVIGIGPGHPDYLVPAALKAADKCQVLAGGNRALDLFPGSQWEKFVVTGKLTDFKEYVQAQLAEGKTVGVLVSGDPGFYSLLPFIRKHFAEVKLEVVPGLSSLQMAFARAGIPWQDAGLTSAHGRDLNQDRLNLTAPLGFLTGKDNSPQTIAGQLIASGRVNPDARVMLGNDLSYPQEIWLQTTLAELAEAPGEYPNAVLLILPSGEEI